MARSLVIAFSIFGLLQAARTRSPAAARIQPNFACFIDLLLRKNDCRSLE
jgi:hypothetical protein